ncbi:MAG: mycofactocin biosynthesis chaperone MftB [Streptosporangiaceae bacterium]
MRRLLTAAAALYEHPVAFDLDRAYRLNPAATLRPEPFGALIYHFGNRRLSFLKTRQLVTVVQTPGAPRQCGRRPGRSRRARPGAGALHRGAGRAGRFGGYRCVLTNPACPSPPPP